MYYGQYDLSLQMKLEFENQWISQSEQTRQGVIDFWNTHNLLKPDVSGIQRAKEVVWVVRTPSQSIIGVSTAFKAHFKQLHNNFYVFRCAIAPDFRIPGLMSKILVDTRDFLESIHKKDPDPCLGIMTFVENPGVNANRKAVWSASQMVYVGSTPDGKQIRVYYFKGARI